MSQPLFTLPHEALTLLSVDDKQQTLLALEKGQVIFFPAYSFTSPLMQENALFSEKILDGKHKSISYNYCNQRLGGFNSYHPNSELASVIPTLMHDYAEFAKNLIKNLFPEYSEELIWGRTSYRPAEIKGRSISKRQDDTRVHVDSFPASPVNGKRILRVFCNINPHQQPRVWHIGEPFEQILQRFASKIPNYRLWLAHCLHWLKATKSLRSAYDHYQLHLHDKMKLDDGYQHIVKKTQVDFPANSTWLVFTDQVSHAALSGQYLLEQTFYLPVKAMANPEYSPLQQWEKIKAKSLA